MDAKVYFGKVHIIEWLEPGEPKTGLDLFGEVQPMGLMSKPVVESAYQPVTNRDEFLAYLRSIAAEFRITKQLPLLQIETHGIYLHDDKVPDGIGASLDNAILWPDLTQTLIPLNQLTGLRLLLMMASCAGLWGIKMAQPVDRAPFLAIIGPNRAVSVREVLAASIAFYRTIFNGASGDVAIKAMNAAVAPHPLTFGAYNAERLFRDVVEAFFATACVEPALSQRITSLFTKLVAKRFNDTGQVPTREELEQLRAFTRQHIEAHEDWFDNLREHFFFLDLVPENARRFPITIEDCRRFV